MSGSIRKIDARGLPCPEPVVATKKALESGGFDILEVVVGNATAKENVTRFATHAGHSIDGVKDEGPTSIIRIRRNTQVGSVSGSAIEEPATCDDPVPTKTETSDASRISTLFISSAVLGSGNDELGALLMKGFISTLPEAVSLPKQIILMNGGVHLAIEGSASLSNLAKLAALGVEILACGTCLDFYNVKDKLAVGRVSNMFEISSVLLKGSVLSL
jgi:selenium metabolism protein YedF